MSKPTPTTSVIIPTRNRAHSLRRTLIALGQQQPPQESSQESSMDRCEVIVVANDCTDKTVAMVTAFSASYLLRLIETPSAGMSRARNLGADAAQGSLLAFLDDDIEPLPGWLEAHTSAHQGDSNVVAVGPLLSRPLTRPPSLLVERMRAADAAFAAFLAGARHSLDWFCMTGGNLSISTPLFRAAGGFDASLTEYGGEDYEFGCRAQKAGARFVLVAEAGGYHDRSKDGPVAAYLRRARSSGRNDTIIARRHPEIVGRITLGLALRPQTRLGQLGRRFAFDHPRSGDVLAKLLLGASHVLALLRRRRQWNRLVDCLHEYWYFRGVADRVGNTATLTAYCADLTRLPV